MEGRCQCSLIRFTTPLPEPIKIFVCHCTECRHQSSSAYGISVIFPVFEIPDPKLNNKNNNDYNTTSGKGDENAAIGIYTRQTLTGHTLECLFCRNCGARLIDRIPGEPTLCVKGGCLVGLNRAMMTKAAHVWCKEAVVEVPEGVERWEENPRWG
ncbi:hypothetical protein VTN77DRAFT_2651 [Rasamsonia byssochlamydoides]|uniref:uncharacterized protein n=1 Tax=Rasamsonia byssochlamydoides TaxID=89139 RepID=UPI0037425CE0